MMDILPVIFIFSFKCSTDLGVGWEFSVNKSFA